MSFTDAVRSVLTQYAVFSGRARRSEFWFYMLAFVIVYAAVAALDSLLSLGFLALLMSLALLLPNLAVIVRRLHDTDRPWWWVLVGMVPVVNLLVIVYLATDGTPGPNTYGPDPKNRQPARA